MAIASSGAIRLDADILVELGQGNEDGGGLSDASRGIIDTINTNNAVADRPDGSTPHAMSEFYSYDHSASSGASIGSYGNGSSNILWTGNKLLNLQTNSVDISSSAYCNTSVVGQTGHIYYRIKSAESNVSTPYKQDAQIYRVNYSGYGYSNVGSTSGTYGFANWYATRRTTNETYNHSTGWNAIITSGTAGWWNRKVNGTPSSGTGVPLSAGYIYYEGSGSNAYGKDVYLRSPEITFNTNTIATESYAYGSAMGTLYMGVYITG